MSIPWIGGFERLIDCHRTNHSKKNLPDVLFALAMNIETALIMAGGKAGEDYKLLDLFKMAAPMLPAIEDLEWYPPFEVTQEEFAEIQEKIRHHKSIKG